MYEATHLSLPTFAKRYITFFLQLYPIPYRKKFGQEIYYVFQDVYNEELAKHGKVTGGFWILQAFDFIKSAGEQHVSLINKIGMKKYLNKSLHINRYNVIGFILLLPFLSVFLIDVISRIAQGDLTHYNRPVYTMLSHTLFYWTPILFIWVIVSPTLAVLINLIPLIQNLKKKHAEIKLFTFIRQNIVTLLIVAIGLGFIAIIKLHDFAPCVFHGTLKIGIGQLPHIISVCRNA